MKKVIGNIKKYIKRIKGNVPTKQRMTVGFTQMQVRAILRDYYESCLENVTEHGDDNKNLFEKTLKEKYNSRLVYEISKDVWEVDVIKTEEWTRLLLESSPQLKNYFLLLMGNIGVIWNTKGERVFNENTTFDEHSPWKDMPSLEIDRDQHEVWCMTRDRRKYKHLSNEEYGKVWRENVKKAREARQKRLKELGWG